MAAGANSSGSAAPRPPAAPSRAVLGARWLMLLAAAGAATLAVTYAVERRAPAATAARFACPMHPEIRSATAGSCPLCSMALEPLRERAAEASDRAGPGPADSVDVGDAVSGRDDGPALPRYSTDQARFRVLHQGIVAPAWVDGDGGVRAHLYHDEADALSTLAPGTLTLGDEGAPTFAVRVAAGDRAPWDLATVEVPLEIVGDLPRPGAVGRVRFASAARQVLVVPASSVLGSPEGAYVLVKGAREGLFTTRSVVTGRSFAGFVAIASGLTAGEAIVSINGFFLDAERRSHTASAATTASVATTAREP